MPGPQDVMPSTEPPRLILASQSPGRGKLLRDAGYRFTQQSPPFADPDQPEATQPHSIAQAESFATDLAHQKALSMAGTVAGPAILLAADTLCVSMTPGREGTLIGKPRDRADAKQMLLGFLDAEHAVVSGVALLPIDAAGECSQLTRLADTAVVAFGRVSEGELERYLDSGLWQGKAGGYNLFDREQADWPITVTGDPTTVVGLPMRKLVAALASEGIAKTP